VGEIGLVENRTISSPRRASVLTEAAGEGRYLLPTHLTETDPAKLSHFYLQLVAVEEAFKKLKGDLAIRPIFHQLDRRIEAHIFIMYFPKALHPCTPGSSPSSLIARTSR
jgi:hypothetical protein